MTQFAKIFECSKRGQMLVTKDITDEQKPCLKLTVDLTDRVPWAAFCSVSLEWDGDDAGYQRQQNAFDDFGVHQANELFDHNFSGLIAEESPTDRDERSGDFS